MTGGFWGVILRFCSLFGNPHADLFLLEDFPLLEAFSFFILPRDDSTRRRNFLPDGGGWFRVLLFCACYPDETGFQVSPQSVSGALFPGFLDQCLHGTSLLALTAVSSFCQAAY